jgi:hypothetical protein
LIAYARNGKILSKKSSTHTGLNPAVLSAFLPAFAWLGVIVAIGLFAVTASPTAVQAQDSSGISSPGPGAAINGDVPIIGTATIDPFQKYELHYKQEPSGDDAYIYFAGGTSPVINGQLGVWQAGGLPPGTYALRLRVVKVDGNYAEFYIPNISVNQAGGAAPMPTATPELTPTATPTFTPAPQPTAVIGQVTQPQVEGDAPPSTATPTPAAVAAGDAAAAGAPVAPEVVPDAGAALPTAGLLPGAQDTPVQTVAGASMTDQLGESLGFERLRTQFLNGVRISAALFIGFAALLAGKKLFEWVWKKYG